MKIKIIDIRATSVSIGIMMEKRGVTARQVQAALRLECVQTVYKWTSPNYKTLPSLDHLIQLTDLLSCSMEDILVTKEIDV